MENIGSQISTSFDIDGSIAQVPLIALLRGCGWFKRIKTRESVKETLLYGSKNRISTKYERVFLELTCPNKRYGCLKHVWERELHLSSLRSICCLNY